MFYVSDFTSKNTKEIYNEDELSTKVFDSIKYYREKCEELTRENKKLKKNALEVANDELKDENQYLKKQLELSYGAFASKKEAQAYNDFVEEHMHDRATSKYNGGRAPYLVPTGTGLGVLLKVVCPICGESKDITDVGAW